MHGEDLEVIFAQISRLGHAYLALGTHFKLLTCFFLQYGNKGNFVLKDCRIRHGFMVGGEKRL